MTEEQLELLLGMGRDPLVLGRSRGGLSTKVHAAAEQGQKLMGVVVTAGQRGDSPQFAAVLEQGRLLRRRGIRATIPDKKDHAAHRVAKGSAGGRPPKVGYENYKKRHAVECMFNRLKRRIRGGGGEDTRRRARREARARAFPRVQIGVEEIGWGYRTNIRVPDEVINGRQRVVSTAELWRSPTPRVFLRGPDVLGLLDQLGALGVTATSGGSPDWIDVTPPGLSKATALEAVRERLGIAPEDTVAVGDGHNDLAMLTWAYRGVTMGHAPPELIAVADEVTGTLAEMGVVPVLRSLIPPEVPAAELSLLAVQLTAAIRTATGPAFLHVWHGVANDLAGCEVWTLHTGEWNAHASIPAAARVTMRDVENAAREAGLDYPSGEIGRRRAQWRTTPSGPGRPAGFELPVQRV